MAVFFTGLGGLFPSVCFLQKEAQPTNIPKISISYAIFITGRKNHQQMKKMKQMLFFIKIICDHLYDLLINIVRHFGGSLCSSW